MRINFTTISIEDLVDRFAGRKPTDGTENKEEYDDSKPMKIYELNRDFVWTEPCQKEFIKSILDEYPIPSIIICNGFIVDGGNRTTTLWRFRRNKFSINIDGIEYFYEDIIKNRDISRKWDRYQIPIQQITEATRENISQIYENVNKNVALTFGQKLENRKYVPIVDAALSIIARSQNNSQFPHRELLSRVWTKFPGKLSKGRVELAFAFQLLLGSIYGPDFFHSSFTQHVEKTFGDTEVCQNIEFSHLRIILVIIDEVDPENTVPRLRKAFCFKKFVGGLIYDIASYGNTPQFVEKKWQTMFREAYNALNSKQIIEICDVGTDRGTHMSRLAALSKNVQDFIDGKFQFKSTINSVDNSEEESDE